MFGWHRALDEDLGKLRQRLEEVEGKMRARDLEYEELLDKVKRWMQRTSARVSKEQAEEDARRGQQPDDGMDPISRAIVQRRGRNGHRIPEEEG